MYIYIYVYIYKCISVYVNMYIYICIYMYIYLYLGINEGIHDEGVHFGGELYYAVQSECAYVYLCVCA